MKIHPLAAAFPMLPGDELAKLAADIHANGLRNKIKLLDGAIIDGRNRYEACQMADVRPEYETFTGTFADARRLVVSENIYRRHLSKAQVAQIVLDIDGFAESYAAADGSLSDPGRANKRIADEIGTGAQTVKEAKSIRAKDPELAEAVKRGDVTGAIAYDLISERGQKLHGLDTALWEDVRDGKTSFKAAAQKAEQRVRMQAEADAARDAQIELPLHEFYVAPCRSLIGAVDAKSVDVIITDPPYPHEFIECYDELAEFAAHALKPGALLYTMAGHTFLPEVIDKLSNYGLLYHWTCAIRLTGRHGNVIGRCTNIAWKPLLVFTAPGGSKKQIGFDLFESAGSESEVLHEWGQSLDVCQKIIERCSEPDDLVCDPFLGSGTFAVAALTAGRRFIGADIEQRWIDTTYERLGRPAAA